MDTHEAAERFVRVWRAGWQAHDVASIETLYADDCVHRSTPFRPAHRGRAGVAEYVRWSFSDGRDERVRFGRPVVSGDRAVVEYWVTMVDGGDDKPATLAGCGFLRFNRDGQVVESHDYWHTADGHHEPPAGLLD